MSRLMDGPNEVYEKTMNDLALGYQQCPGMVYKGHSEEKIVETINKALSVIRNYYNELPICPIFLNE